MKIVRCPKGGKMPAGYCNKSCLNYCIERETDEVVSSKKAKREMQQLNFKRVRVDTREGHYNPPGEPSSTPKIVFSFN